MTRSSCDGIGHRTAHSDVTDRLAHPQSIILGSYCGRRGDGWVALVGSIGGTGSMEAIGKLSQVRAIRRVVAANLRVTAPAESK